MAAWGPRGGEGRDPRRPGRYARRQAGSILHLADEAPEGPLAGEGPSASVGRDSVARVTAQPHDALVKAALSRPENAIGALRAVLPAALLAQLDLATLRLSPTTFVREDLAKLYADLVYEVQLAGRPGLVCFVLYEHQSTVDPVMPVRVLGYLARAWAYWLEAHPGADAVPAIVPIVLYHGERPWTAPTSLAEVLDLPEEGLRAAGELLPSLRFALDDLSRVPDEDLRAREASVFGRLSLLLLKHARSLAEGHSGPGSLEAFLRSVGDLLRRLPDRADRVRAFCYMIEVVGGADPAALLTAMGPQVAPEVREDVMNAADQLRLEGQRRVLLRQLRIKFPPLPADAERRVCAADEATLDRWTAAVLGAKRIEDVWAA